jgi:hypothetical protein
VGLIQELLEFMINRTIEKNYLSRQMALITLVMQGGGVARTKHIQTRMQLVLEVLNKASKAPICLWQQ